MNFIAFQKKRESLLKTKNKLLLILILNRIFALKNNTIMTVTFTITDDNSYSLAFLEYIKKLDFIKNIKIKEKKTTSVKSFEEDLEEDEYGMPIKYRDETMVLSKQANRNMTKRWEAAIAKKEKE